jgi:hypothetical protein
LANGLQVVVLPKHRAPAVTQMVWYKTGAADDPRGKSGIAHFLEHLMFKGTKANPPGAFTALIAQSGGRDNAFTSQDVHGLPRDRGEGSARNGDAARGRPHDRPAVSTMRCSCRSATSSSKSAACGSTTTRPRCFASS